MLNLQDKISNVLSFLRRKKNIKINEVKLLPYLGDHHATTSKSLITTPDLKPKIGVGESFMQRIVSFFSLLRRKYGELVSRILSLVNQQYRQLCNEFANLNNVELHQLISLKTASLFIGGLVVSFVGYSSYQAYYKPSAQNKNFVFVDLPKQTTSYSPSVGFEQHKTQQIVITSSGDIVRNLRKDGAISRIVVDKNGMVIPRL